MSGPVGGINGEADPVALSIQGPVATLTLNRPEKLNALSAPMFTRMRQHLDYLASVPDLSCLVLQGAGRSFCAGHDLDDLASGEEEDQLRFEAETIALLESFRCPTVAKIHGHCVTGGLELALACDILVCSDDTKFGDTHGKWGLVPGWGMSVRLPERVGIAVARELSYTSRVFPGSEALRMGLVNRSVPSTLLDAEVSSLVDQIVQNSRESNETSKALYGGVISDHRQDHLDYERSRPFGVPSDGPMRMQQGLRKL